MTLLAVLLLMGQMQLSLGRAEKSPQGEREERTPISPIWLLSIYVQERWHLQGFPRNEGFPNRNLL